MSKALYTILAADATLTALLDNGASSVYSFEATQGDGVPHVVVMGEDNDPINTNSPTNTDEATVSVFCVSDRPYTSASIAGAYEVAEAVRTALVDEVGTFGGEYIKSCELDNQSAMFNEGTPNNPRFVIEQVYQIFKAI